jgi:hypothetical protein
VINAARPGPLLTAAFLAAAAAGLVAAARARSSHERFGFDEFLTELVCGERGPVAVVDSCREQINAFPPLYFVVIWGWAKAFGTSEWALRSFSALCGAGCVAAAWACLRRYFPGWPALLGAITVYGAAGLFRQHCWEARPYTLLCLQVNLACWLACRSVEAGRVGWVERVATALLFAALVMTHYFGVVYAALVVAAAVGADALAGRFRPGRYLPAVAGGGVFLFWMPVLLGSHSRMGGANLYIARPVFSDLVQFYNLGAAALGGLVLAVIGAAVAHNALVESQSPSAGNRAPPVKHMRPMVLAAAGLLLLPAALWVYSQGRQSLFLTRYMTPSILGAAAAAGYAAAALLRPAAAPAWRRRAAEFILAAVVSGAAALPVVTERARPDAMHVGSPDLGLEADDLPVVIENAGQFLHSRHYARDGRLYLFPLSESAAFDPRASRFARNHYQMLRALGNRNLPSNVLEGEEILRKYPAFYLVDEADMLWSDEIRGQPGWEMTLVKQLSPGVSVYRVRRKGR